MTESTPDPAPLQIQCFGRFAVQAYGRPLASLRTRKGEWLLALLALRAGQKIEREWLAGTLWPDSGEQNALANLRNSLKDLRRVLGLDAWRVSAPTTRTLSLDLAGATVDVLAFDGTLARGDPASLEAAVALYRGPLLEGCTEEWVFQERQAREQAYLGALEKLAATALDQRELGTAEGYLRRVVAVDPLRETALRALMQVLAAAGNCAAALTAYRDLRLRLHRELNLEPDSETQAFFQRLRAEARGKAEGDRSRAPGTRGGGGPGPGVPAGCLQGGRMTPWENRGDRAIHSLEVLSHNLPLPLTRFIGREEPMAAVEQRLAEHRLVTLTGAGGSGKTRLALQVAAGRLEAYKDGVWLVELAGLSDPGLVPQAVAAALGVREEPGCPLTAMLADHLRARSLLLVLDNCEHLLPACAGLAETLLQRCGNLRLLTTSREGLRIAGEATYRVPPLSLPDLERLPPAALLTQFEAVQLFVECARAALPSFLLNDQNATAVARVCHRLDGLPLAIELAAARVKALPVEQIDERLDDRFRLLTGGSRTALPRQQTLRATIDWSYDLLSETERALLRRLSVFAGGWTLAAAEAVCGGDGIKERDVLDLLAGLVEKSLAVYEERASEARYRLLETIRQYASERLVEVGELEGVGQRHRDHYLTLAEEAARHLYGAEQAAWQQRLEHEHDNLRAALDWGLTGDDGAEAALRLVGAMGQFWLMGSHFREGMDWATRALARGRNARPLVLAQAMLSGCGCADHCEDELAGHLGEQALRYAREAYDPRSISDALFSGALRALGLGEFETAQASTEEGMALAQAEGDRWLIGRHQVPLGLMAWMRGDYVAARACFQQALEISRELADEWHIAMTQATLAFVTRGAGDDAGARSLHLEGLPLSQRLGDRRGIGWHLVGMAGVEVSQGRAVRAALLLGAAMAVLEVIGSPLPPFLQREHDHILEQTEATLGEGAFATAWEAGWTLSLAEAVVFAVGATPED